MIQSERLAERAKTLFNIHLTDRQLEQLVQYAIDMVEWPANLTSIKDPNDIEIKHFLDSMSLFHHFEIEEGAQIVDIGTGAGLPGIVMKILRPDLHITLIESVGKKTAFLNHVCHELGLDRVQVLRLRAETVGQDRAHREKYDWVIARAVAHLPALVEYMLPLCVVDGRCIAMKGSSAIVEVGEAEEAIETLGGKFINMHTVNLPEVESPHMLVVIQKVRPTPTAFPRREGLPTKRPIGSDM